MNGQAVSNKKKTKSKKSDKKDKENTFEKSAEDTLLVRDQSLITGEGGLVQKRGGSDIFVHEKSGGQKFLCNINTCLA